MLALLVSGTSPSMMHSITVWLHHVGLNIGAHKEAAEHFLSALSMQETTGEKSKQLLQTLRRAFLAMVCSLVSLRYTTRDIDVLYILLGSQGPCRSHGREPQPGLFPYRRL